MLTVVSDYEDELRAVASDIARAEAVLAELRRRRDRIIGEGVRARALTERRAAVAAGVSPSFAHRAAHAGRSRSSGD